MPMASDPWVRRELVREAIGGHGDNEMRRSGGGKKQRSRGGEKEWSGCGQAVRCSRGKAETTRCGAETARP
ncbi:hypothetical protein PR202_ga29968 [Eleusine coracana subsp. coracana]|uniref:Uncharacterized protein n=1 Tax=Eleusine coracana subsp. coracana TaxID=191504 RepID=A0AAV5DN42_ELECO|nr:hypothetical protein PR202_ga29968 [Eleusine coracana subsp. coracana]